MSLLNKFLLQNIEKIGDDRISPIPVKINFNPEGATGAKSRGYLSERLRSYKKSLDPLNKQSMRTTIMNKLFFHKQPPNTSHKLLPKLHRYVFPLQQQQDQNTNIKQKSRLKASSIKILKTGQKEKRNIDRNECKNKIDKILLEMFDEQDIVSKKIKRALQNSEQINNDFKRRSVDPRIQNIVCSGKQYISSQAIKFRRGKDALLPRQLSHKRFRDSQTQMRSLRKAKAKKYKQLKGWQVQQQDDLM